MLGTVSMLAEQRKVLSRVFVMLMNYNSEILSVMSQLFRKLINLTLIKMKTTRSKIMTKKKHKSTPKVIQSNKKPKKKNL